MKKIIFIIGGVILVALLGRIGWAYWQVKSDEASMVTNFARVGVTTVPATAQVKSDNGTNLIPCIIEKNRYSPGAPHEQYTVGYPDTWESKGCAGAFSPDDRGRYQDFLRVEELEILPLSQQSPSMKANLATVKRNLATGDITVDGLPAFQDFGNSVVSKSVVFIKGNWQFTLRKGKMTSDEIFDKFVKSFYFID